tara:strand:+ start:22 stop:330 length:309 start_codon:yes stop_codon:yes gene_type:complete
MSHFKTLQKGETLAINGACVITAIGKCKLAVDAEDSVAIDCLDWSIGFSSGYLRALGDSMQTYWIDDDGASYYESGSDVEHRIYEGDRPKTFCEVHNMKWGK